ncbi:MAG: NAD-glutamate dehydrogenase [Nocardiopsis sp. BM-2018]|nr:MAG: NAD-glutamate dehydrogenase [Nocardiopsis sp. BM-2018]
MSTRRRIVQLARDQVPGDELTERFVGEYYHEMPSVDLDDRGVGDLLAVALAHLQLGRTRRWGETCVDVVSPDREIDGWHSPRSVLLLVTDDAPFLVDTVRMVLDRHGLETHLLVHPMLEVRRDDAGRLLDCTDVSPSSRSASADATGVEAWTQVEIDRCDASAAAALVADVREIVEEVHGIVADFPAMRSWMDELATEDPLLAWLADGNFVFLGAATYDRDAHGGLVARAGTELGILRRPHPIDPAPVPVEISDQTPVVVSRSDAESRIHRPARRTCISVRAGDGARHRFLGLLASSAYRQSVLDIPVVGDRVRSVLGLTGDTGVSYSARAARNVLETLPRDLLFELDADSLARLTIDVVGLQERHLVRVFDVPEPVGDNSTVMVYLPRSRFHAELPDAVAQAVADAYGSGFRDVESLVGQSSLARITCTVTRSTASGVELDQLAARIDELSTSWSDRVIEALVGELGEQQGRRLAGRHLDAFPAEYRANVGPARAVSDLLRIDELVESGARLATSLGRDRRASGSSASTTVISRSRSRRCCRCSDISVSRPSTNDPRRS